MWPDLITFLNLKEKYADLLGDYAEPVGVIASLVVAAALMLVLVTGKPSGMLPLSDNGGKMLQRVLVITVGVFLVLLTAADSGQGAGIDMFLVGMVLAIAGLCGAVVFAALRWWLIWEAAPAEPEAGKPARPAMIKGLWRTSEARKLMAGDFSDLPEGFASDTAPSGLADYYDNNGRDRDLIWPRAARFWSWVLILPGYVVMCVGLAAALLAFALEMTRTPEVAITDGGPIVLPAGVLFSHDQADLPDYGRAALEKTLPALVAQSPTRLTITGHTDSTGDDGYNLALSLRRAQAVENWLAMRPELEGVEFEAIGKGETDLMFPEEGLSPLRLNEARLGNRRVEIEVSSP